MLQDVVDARNAQGLIKELGKFLEKKKKKIHQGLLKLTTLPRKGSI